MNELCPHGGRFLIIVMLYRSTQDQKSWPIPRRHYFLETQRLLFLPLSECPVHFSVSLFIFQCLSLYFIVDFHFLCLSPFTMSKAAHIVHSSLSKNIVQWNNDPVLWRHLPETEVLHSYWILLDWFYNWLQIVLRVDGNCLLATSAQIFWSSLATVLQSQWGCTTTSFPWILTGVSPSICW